MKRITVLISDDHSVVREGLRQLLAATDDIEVIGEAEDGHRAVGETKRLQPDVVVMDLAMPLLNGVEATRRIAREVPAAKVLILSSYSDEQHVQQAVGAGASGYLMKEAASEDLLQAIREASNGNPSFSPPIARRLLKQWLDRDPKTKTTGSPMLSGRQTEVVQLIAEGYSSKQIASVLSVSLKTVEKHRQSLMDKLDIHKIATLTRYAVAHGLVESEPHSRLAGRNIRRIVAVKTAAREAMKNRSHKRKDLDCGKNIICQ